MKNLQKKIQSTESAYDVCTEDLFNQVTSDDNEYGHGVEDDNDEVVLLMISSVLLKTFLDHQTYRQSSWDNNETNFKTKFK